MHVEFPVTYEFMINNWVHSPLAIKMNRHLTETMGLRLTFDLKESLLSGIQFNHHLY